MKSNNLRLRDVSVTGTPTTSSAGQGSDRKIVYDAYQNSVSLLWHSLTPEARNGFQNLCLQLPGNRKATKKGDRLKVTAFLLFSSLNHAARNSGAASTITVPPAAPEYAQPLPDTLRLVSARTASGQWSLRLVGGTYSQSVAVYLAPPVMSGTNVYRRESLAKAGPLPNGIPAGGADLTALFLSLYPVAPLNGQKVAVQIMGVTPSGFHSAKVFLESITGPALQEAAGTGDETRTPGDAPEGGTLHVV